MDIQEVTTKRMVGYAEKRDIPDPPPVGKDPTDVDTCAIVKNLVGRRRVMFLCGLILGALLMVWEDPSSYCAAKRMLWTRSALLVSDPICATYQDASILPRRLSSGINSLKTTIATTMPEGLKLNFSEVQRRVEKMNELVDFMPSIAFTSDEVKRGQDDGIGYELASEGSKAKHPVFMVPGIITTGLELWKGEDCARKYFRQRVWGTFSSIEMFLLNPRCWLKHMSLDPTTGLDPENITIRAALGFEAADYVIGGYWVWAKLIENLAAVGYTPLSMEMMGYDWRLSFRNLEIRDKFYSQLKTAIELKTTINQEKSIIVAHSMGGNVMFYFLQWAEAQEKGWCDKYVEAFVPIGVPFLGMPSALTRVLTGVIREFTELGTMITSLMDMHMSHKDRRQMMRSWGSVFSLLPRGGDKVWNHNDHFLMDEEIISEENIASLDDHKANDKRDTKELAMLAMFDDTQGMGTEAMMDALGGRAVSDSAVRIYWKENTHGFGNISGKYEPNWTNVLQAPLPTRDMKVYCLYGYGRQTERAYHYAKTQREDGEKADEDPGESGVCATDRDGEDQTCKMPTDDAKTIAASEEDIGGKLEDNTYMIDMKVQHSKSPNYVVRNGVRYVDGDGSVPLLSMGYMCIKGWRPGGKLNPGGSPIFTREYRDNPTPTITDPLGRSGPESADHVDIMGNHGLLRDLVLIAVGRGSEVSERIGSKIRQISDGIDI